MILTRVLDIQANLAAWRDAMTLMSQRRSLLAMMTWRDLTDRYAGQALGAAWAVISPLLMMADVYVGLWCHLSRPYWSGR